MPRLLFEGAQQRSRPRVGLLVTSGLLCGCGVRQQVELTTFDVAAVTDQAMQQLDSDQDGELSSSELKQSPGLRRSRKEIDTDRDGKISAAELQSRLQTYIDQRIER